VKLDRRIVVNACTNFRLCVSPQAAPMGGYPYEIYDDLREHRERVGTLGDTNYETRDDFSDVRLKRRIFAHSVTRLRLACSRAIDAIRCALTDPYFIYNIAAADVIGITTSGRL